MYDTPLTGLILGGGGARAAYQVGVLRAIARLRREHTGHRGRLRNPFGVIVGTSAGAINAAALAGDADDFERGGAMGTIVWELANPVSILHRGLIFGIGLAWIVVLTIFLFDVFVMRNGWCGHFCPVGAFYSLIGRFSVLRIRLPKRSDCNDCMDCFAVCPEQQVIRPALKAINNTGPLILEANCTNCGRCIDVCSKEVFQFGLRSGKHDLDPGGVAGAKPK